MSVRTVQVAETASGAIYAHCNGVLLRFKGYRIHTYNLESGQPAWVEGNTIHALVLPENGKGVGTVDSTRMTRVYKARANALGHLPTQIAQIARAATALDLVGVVDNVELVSR